MADLDFVESFKVDLTCPVCLEYFTDPVLIRCGHSFCRECLFRDAEVGHTANACPLCRAIIQQGNKLRSNRMLENLATKGRILRSLLLQRIKGLTICDQHGKEESLFCEEDQRPLCESCSFSIEHKEHRVLPLEKAAEQCMKELKEKLKILRKKHQKFQVKLDSEKTRKLYFKEKNQASKVLALCEYENMHKILLEEEELHLQRLGQEAGDKLAESEEIQTGLCKGIHNLQLMMADTEKNVEKSPEEMLQQMPHSMWNTLRRGKDRFQTELECEKEKEAQWQLKGQAKKQVMAEYQKKHQALSEEAQLYVQRLDQEARDNLAKYEDSQTRLSQHIHNLQIVMSEAEGSFEKPLLEILQDGKGTLERTEELLLQDPGVAFPTWTQFPLPAMTEMLMTFHRDLTLDPETAHSHLILSDDLKSVRFVRASGDQPDPWKSLKSNMTVLATQSFTSGKHYWEVEVGDKIPWEVGVCKISKNEQEATKLSWIVWTLTDFQSGKEFSSQNAPYHQNNHKLGFFLDYERARVTLYDATYRTLLWNITNLDFDGAVYPCFSPFVLNEEMAHGQLFISPRSKQ